MNTDEEILSAEFEKIVSQLRKRPSGIYEGVIIFLKSVEFILKFFAFAIQPIVMPILAVTLVAFTGIISYVLIYKIFL